MTTTRLAAGRGLVVVGGGVLGVMTTLEAARRGIPVTLVERGEVGAATSANTLRILHGGMRHLQRLDVGELRASAAEQRWFLDWFPDLVTPLPCLLPLHGEGFERPLTFDLVFAAMAAVLPWRDGSATPHGEVLSASGTVELCPALERDGLHGGALWFEATMPQPRALLAAVLAWAKSYGARVLERTSAEAVLLGRNGAVAGLRCRGVDGATLDLDGSWVVNCAGPWCRELARSVDRDVPNLFRPSIGFNLLIDQPPPACAAVACRRRAGRGTVFLVPAGNQTLAGTWHLPLEDRPLAVAAAPTEAEVSAAYEDVVAGLPGWAPRQPSIDRVLWGFLPAAAEGSARMRQHDVLHDHGRAGGPRGLLSVSGSKFTTARRTAERALAALSPSTRPAAAPRPVLSAPVP